MNAKPCGVVCKYCEYQGEASNEKTFMGVQLRRLREERGMTRWPWPVRWDFRPAT